MTIDHYENFPVASLLCPPHLRPAITALYGFARTADDLADEGNASPQRRLSDLGAYHADLQAVFEGTAPSARWSHVFEPLRKAIAEHALPIHPLAELLSAFAQDVVKTAYADRAELLDYCRRSANPVGRLLLHLYGVRGLQAERQSDAVCSALQLANFWQDLSIDTERGRVYAPVADCIRHGVAPRDLLAQRDAPQARALVAELVHWARDLMLAGAPLVHALPGRAGWELRLVVQGGLRILDKIESIGFATLQSRPTLHWGDGTSMLWRALWMRAPVASESA